MVSGTARRVLDAWPVCKWLQNEPRTCTRVQTLLDQAASGNADLFINMINVGEVFYTLARQTSLAEAEEFIEKVLPAMPISVVMPDAELIVAAARWKARTRISYADAFAIATAERLDCLVVTGDPELKALGSRWIDWIGVE